ncbi:hypothetical protein ACODT5_10575 [Streptomyces sp. 5.8]|uniref:hypothetical protein n=1 Tax=Streptomyces sp. 5.8 TaxID=3406571 RepID=UPI003BB71A02
MSGEGAEDRREGGEAPSDEAIEAETAKNTYTHEVPADDPDAFRNYVEAPVKPEPPKNDDTGRELALTPYRSESDPGPNPERSEPDPGPNEADAAAEIHEAEVRDREAELERGRRRGPAAALGLGPALRVRSPAAGTRGARQPDAPQQDMGRERGPEQGPGLGKGLGK